MTNPVSIPLDFLPFLIRSGTNRHRLRAYLQHPMRIEWAAASEKAATEAYKRMRDALEDGHPPCSLLDLALLTSFLLDGPEVPGWVPGWLAGATSAAKMLPEALWVDPSIGRWQAVPVLMTGETAVRRFLVAGVVDVSAAGEMWPSWSTALMDDACRRALTTAADLACRSAPSDHGQTLVCIPLAAVGDGPVFRGGSLALPVALAFRRLLAGDESVRDVAATGGLDTMGGVLPVAHLTVKATLAGEKEYAALICPHFPTGSEGVSGAVEMLPVSHLDQAFLLAALYSPGRREDLLLFGQAILNAQRFADNCHRMEPAWLAWAAERGLTHSVIERICADDDLFARVIDRLQELLAGWQLDAAAALSSLLPPDRLQPLVGLSPLNAFRWCSLNIALANHRGDVARADRWAQCALWLEKHASRDDLEAFADCLNNRHITLCHNRWVFEPALPADVQNLMTRLETVHRALREGGTRTYAPLGRLYGTVAQNFGFCGPEWLDRTVAYARKAQEAFGGGTSREFRGDYLRQYHYLIYACLDAGDMDQAQDHLWAYLEIDDWQDIERRLGRLGRWQHATLARFFADGGASDLRRQYYRMVAASASSTSETCHPWQLWAWNMGRVAAAEQAPDSAERFWRQSLELCLAPAAGPTIRTMALLPLAALRRMGRMPAGEIDGVLAAIQETPGVAGFAASSGEDADTLLGKVWRRPEAFFPFTYR